MTPRGMVRVLLVTVLLAGCSGGGGDDGAGGTASPSSTRAVPVPTRTVSHVVAERCGLDVPGDVEDLVTADGASRLGAVVYPGDSDVAVVLLHQTGRSGLCGWVTYARWLASQGVTAIALDDCAHGTSACTPQLAADTLGQVRTAVEAARGFDARTVAVVGASMGGARALGVGQQAGADVVVDLSGPTTWEGVPDAATAAAATSVPLLVVTSTADRDIDATALAAAVEASPATRKRFVLLPGDGHGWELTMDGIAADAAVTPQGRAVLAWVRGEG